MGFYRILPRRKAGWRSGSSRVVVQRHLAAMLCIALGIMALWSFGHWLTDLIGYAGGNRLVPLDPNSVFYGDFFTALIFVDVILPVTSLRYLSDYGLILRNSGFVIATIIALPQLLPRGLECGGPRGPRRHSRPRAPAAAGRAHVGHPPSGPEGEREQVFNRSVPHKAQVRLSSATSTESPPAR